MKFNDRRRFPISTDRTVCAFDKSAFNKKTFYDLIKLNRKAARNVLSSRF